MEEVEGSTSGFTLLGFEFRFEFRINEFSLYGENGLCHKIA